MFIYSYNITVVILRGSRFIFRKKFTFCVNIVIVFIINIIIIFFITIVIKVAFVLGLLKSSYRISTQILKQLKVIFTTRFCCRCCCCFCCCCCCCVCVFFNNSCEYKFLLSYGLSALMNQIY